MLKILQAHLLPAFVANSKIDAIYALYLESFCDKILLSGKFSLFLTLSCTLAEVFCTRPIPSSSTPVIAAVIKHLPILPDVSPVWTGDSA